MQAPADHAFCVALTACLDDETTRLWMPILITYLLDVG